MLLSFMLIFFFFAIFSFLFSATINWVAGNASKEKLTSPEEEAHHFFSHHTPTGTSVALII
jgi:hypothetical protein